MAETLLIAVALLAGFVVFFVLDAQGKARAFGEGQVDPAGHRRPEAVTSVHLPPPHFNEMDPVHRRRESL